MIKKIFLYNGFKYEGEITLETEDTITLKDVTSKKNIKIYKRYIIAEVEQ